MGRLCAGLAAAILLAIAAPGLAGDFLPRTVEEPYRGAGYVQTDTAEIQGQCTTVDNDNYGGACFRARPREHRVALEIRDETGLPVGAVVFQGNRRLAEFCQRTRTPLIIRPGKVVSVVARLGGCGSASSAPTRGVIRATFSR